MQANQLIFLSLLSYLLGFVVIILLRKKENKQLLNGFSIFLNVVGFLLAALLFTGFQEGQTFHYTWFNLGENQFRISLLVNQLTVLMFILVQFISLLVQIFSTKYMKGDARIGNYYSYLNLFIFSMLGLVVSGNLLLLFIFWELVGFCSYLLIGFWFEKKTATDASLKAFLMNRVGDAGFLIGIGLTYFLYQSLDLSDLSTLFNDNNSLSTIAVLALFGGCMGKSAQLPLQVWLPDAMAGPTPASALIHAATMVAAGIFLLARIDFMITPTAGIIIAGIGALTALMAAYSAIYQFDIKKVLAFSTVSQLGLMVMAMGAGATNAALFHLLTHAFFKAGLFLIAGAVIDHLHHKQDMREMGGLLRKKPILALSYLICGGALAGLPLTAGFLSKDAVILSSFNWAADKDQPLFFLIPLMGIIASVMTAFYVSRQFTLVFLQKQDGGKEWSKPTVYEWAILPLVLLSTWAAHSLNPLDFEHSYFSKALPIAHQANHWVAYALLAFAILAIYLAWQKFRNFETKALGKSFDLGQNHFGIDDFYVKKLAPFIVGNHTIRGHETDGLADMVNSFDKAVVEGVSVNIEKSNKNLAKGLHYFDNGIVDGSVKMLVQSVIKLGKTGSFMDTKLVDGVIRFISEFVSNIGAQVRKIQSGQIQSYLMALIVILIALLIFLASI
ncbi:NADH-quinone oxidoreductase subunit 5 family protein [Jiulongibacter sp. NS-SX5]|uniref:NADH-quinone oxidoreductase subunit 5 family protein n=1 Tax=Jiulongibacter sp. NS-SX5 TaxID=3463854 RepID=UPI0040596C8B